jgi:hypothetical protein
MAGKWSEAQKAKFKATYARRLKQGTWGTKYDAEARAKAKKRDYNAEYRKRKLAEGYTRGPYAKSGLPRMNGDGRSHDALIYLRHAEKIILKKGKVDGSDLYALLALRTLQGEL